MNPEQSHSSNPHSQITGLILAGGQGRRMGRVDKGLQLLQGRRMVDHVYQRLSPQVGGIVISANQNQDAYRSFGVRVVSDIVSAAPGDDRGAGPLAGLHAGLSVSKRPLLLSVPCDTPFIPADLVARLHTQLEQAGAQIAVVRERKFALPVAPNRLPEEPLPNDAPMSAPLPCCTSTKPIIAMAATICNTTNRFIQICIQELQDIQ